ncbi:MAG TPA: hypothetical protein VN083_00215 [Vicinamibacteria bacterium]|nr:hypothetical protein [Vicinamibacteria bacterium]
MTTFLGQSQALCAVSRFVHLVTIAFERFHEYSAKLVLIVDQQQSSHSGAPPSFRVNKDVPRYGCRNRAGRIAAGRASKQTYECQRGSVYQWIH